MLRCDWIKYGDFSKWIVYLIFFKDLFFLKFLVVFDWRVWWWVVYFFVELGVIINESDFVVLGFWGIIKMLV